MMQTTAVKDQHIGLWVTSSEENYCSLCCVHDCCGYHHLMGPKDATPATHWLAGLIGLLDFVAAEKERKNLSDSLE